MEEKSIYNMIICILSAVSIIPLMVLGAVGQYTHSHHLIIIMMNIFYPLLATSFILKSIYYGKDSSSKEPLMQIAKAFLDLSATIITIGFLLTTTNPAKWVIFGFLVAATVMEVILDSINKGLEVKYLFTLLKAFLFLFSAITLNGSISIILVLILSLLLGFISDLLGNYLKNKIILSYEIISLILFGIFLIVI